MPWLALPLFELPPPLPPLPAPELPLPPEPPLLPEPLPAPLPVFELSETAICKGFCEDAPLKSETVTEKLKVPLALGVPETFPVLLFKSTPEGNWPEVTLKVYGAVPPETVRAPLYPAPTDACGRLADTLSPEAEFVPILLLLLGLEELPHPLNSVAEISVLKIAAHRRDTYGFVRLDVARLDKR